MSLFRRNKCGETPGECPFKAGDGSFQASRDQKEQMGQAARVNMREDGLWQEKKREVQEGVSD